MQNFEIIDEVTTGVRKFNTRRHQLVFKIKDVSLPSYEEKIVFFKTAIEQIVVYALSTVLPADKVGITFELCGFKEKLPGFMSFRRADSITFDDVWTILEGILQSDPEALSNQGFKLIVTSIRPPTGRGRQRIHNNFAEECLQRRGIVTISNKDNLCLPRALVVGRAFSVKDSNYKNIRKKQGVQKEKAIKLMKEAGVENITDVGAGIEEIKMFQNYLTDCKITVYQYGVKGTQVLFEGPDAPLKINLLYHENHYNVIISLTSAFCCSYYCELCHIPYNTKDRHRCEKSCKGCGASPPCEKVTVHIKCDDCNRSFYNVQCYENHKNKMCIEVKKCDKCFKTINVKNRKEEHECGEVYCKICQNHKPENHYCYIQPASKLSDKHDTLFVFYDLETMQQKVTADGYKLHEPNLCVLQQVCPNCYNETDNRLCQRCGVREQVLKVNCVENLLGYLLAKRKMFKKVISIAHNSQAFDCQFILNHILTKTSIKPELIMRGSKILMMELGNLKFIDSLNYFPMALTDLPKAFGISESKGYFPHLFNTMENANYVGLLPAIEYYSPDTMKPEARSKFLKWYEENKNQDFDMRRDIVEYCKTDVDILKKACIRFRNLFLEECYVDPFAESLTIASACNLMFRRKFLQPETIGIIPRGGYRRADIHSKIALQWLLSEERKRNIIIKHTGRQSEVKVAGSKVDGIYEKHIFQFHGCYYHGCPSCFITRRDEQLHDDPTDTMNMRYEKTKDRTENLRAMGYEVTEKWECEFVRELKNNSELSDLKDHPVLQNLPLNPRDAFYGGRTGATKLVYEVDQSEQIKYVDVCSLYPWVCKYGKFPVGHPVVYVGDECIRLIEERGIDHINGLIKCNILPPQNLYHPVLPVKTQNKLMFSLCRTCTETLNQHECDHGVEERTLQGTWVIDEVIKAIEKGYTLSAIQEIWCYEVTSYDKSNGQDGLFAGFINTFLQMKQQASGWPHNCTTLSDQEEYIKNYSINEGVQMTAEKIEKNPGLRSLAKLMLNSFWGKFGQRENQPKTYIVNDPMEYYDLVSNPCINMNHVQFVNQDTVVVNWSYKEEAADPLKTVNVVLASYVTTQARLKLCSYLEQLDERVLYYDTDSVIYISRPNEPDLPTGRYLGDLTNELEDYGPDAYINAFACGGPKNYAYQILIPSTGDTIPKIKAKGITLNYETGQIINMKTTLDLILNDADDARILIHSHGIRRIEDHQVVTKSETKTYRVSFKKRRRIENFDSIPYGYKKHKI